MRRLALVLCLLPATAAAEFHWEVLGHAGIGRVFGTGADANRWGGTGGISGGPRLFEWLSIRAHFQVDYLRLRTFASLDEGGGESFMFMIGPNYHPLGLEYPVQPYVGLRIGGAVTRASVREGDAEVELRSRAAVYGGILGMQIPLDRRWAVGLSILALPQRPRKSCIRVLGDVTSCDAESDELNTFGELNLAVRCTFD